MPDWGTTSAQPKNSRNQVVNLLAVAIEDPGRICAQYMIKKRDVNGSEVGTGLQVAGVEICQARLSPEEPTPYASTEQEDRARGAVIGSVACVGHHPAANSE